MKPNHIQRDVRSRKERNIGEAPDLSRVNRVARIQKKESSRTRSRRTTSEYEKGAERGGVPWGLMVLLVLGTFGLIGGAFIFWVRPILDRRADMVEEAANRKVVTQLSDMPELTTPSEGELQEIVEKAMRVTDPPEVDGYFILGSATPEEVVEFLKKMIEEDGAITSYDVMPGMDANDMALEGVLVTFDGEGRKPNRIALLTPDEKGVWKIDFPAFQRRADPPWEQFLAHKAESAVVRVYIAKDNYYNGVFSNEEDWRCYGIASPDVKDLMFGYCRRNSDQDRAMWQIIQDQPNGLARATVELGLIDEAGVRQFEVKKVMAQDWVVSGVPFDER